MPCRPARFWPKEEAVNRARNRAETRGDCSETQKLDRKETGGRKGEVLLAPAWLSAFLTCFDQGRDYKSSAQEAVAVQNETKRTSAG